MLPLLPPPNRLAMPEIKPPKPAMLPSPPVNTLETPPDAVCLSRFPHILPDCEVVVLLLDGDPNFMPVGTVFAVSEDARVSEVAGALSTLSLPGCEGVTNVDGVKSLCMLWPSTFAPASRLNLPDMLLLRFATLSLRSPRLFQSHHCIGRFGLHFPQPAAALLPPPE